MKNKNTITLIVTIVVLLVLVSVASYAYFAASISNNNVVVVNTTLPAGTATFTTIGASVGVTITSADMLETASSTVAKSNANANLVVTLTGQDPNSTATCTYDIMFKWASADKAYVPTANIPTGEKEFTAQVETATDTTGCNENSTACAAAVVRPSYAETQLTAATTATNPLLLSSGTIKVTGTKTTTMSSKVTMRFYNTTIEQPTHVGKSYEGVFYVDNVVC